MRTLIIQPIVHMPADMGSMQDALMQQGIDKLGEEKWQENQKLIVEFWNKVEEAINKFEGKVKQNNGIILDWHKVRIYQDGMPVGGELAKEMVEKIAAQGSKNYQIIKKLIEKGAIIEETESKELLLKEYEYIKRITTISSEEMKKEAINIYQQAKDYLLKKRDKFIAERINQTLKENETGILFIGAHHQVQPLLEKDIQTKELN